MVKKEGGELATLFPCVGSVLVVITSITKEADKE